MSFEFFSKGTEIIKNGIQKDEAHSYPEALKLYIHGIEHWIAGVKCMIQPLSSSLNFYYNDM